VPQACSVVPGWQVPFVAQHPFGQVAAEQVGGPWHLPLALQVWPGRHVPHVPWLPQPSSPHCRPLQFGAQHNPAPLHWLAGGWQQPSFGQHPVAAGLHAVPLQVSTLAAQTWLKQFPVQQSLF
jgi:hypothetical protein